MDSFRDGADFSFQLLAHLLTQKFLNTLDGN